MNDLSTLKSYSIYSETELKNLVQQVLKNFPGFRVFLLQGELGAGKTTFVRYFVRSFQPDYDVQSPTFNIANSYNLGNLKVLHADLYRLKNEHEVIETGIPELLANCDYALIEWYEHLLPWIEKAVIIKIEIQNHQRIFSFSTFEKKSL